MSTYWDMMNDINFLQKRIKEQKDYIRTIIDKSWEKEISIDRYEELIHSAMPVLDRFLKQLKVVQHRTDVQRDSSKNTSLG